MATSDQIRAKQATTASKKAAVEKDIGDAERRRANKEAEANDKASRAGRATSLSTAQVYLRQAETASTAAAAESKKIATLATKRATLAKEESKLSKDLGEAIKRENAARERMEQRERRERERQRTVDRNATNRRIDGVHLELRQQIARLRAPQQEKLRILYATATPDGDLRVSQEIRRVKNAVKAALHRDLVEIEYAPDVTAQDLLDQLTSFQPHVVHFSGHANETVLAFDDGSIDGANHLISIDAFMRAVNTPDNPPLLVVLNACESAVHLAQLVGRIPLAIGMSDSVGDADGITFATRFYRALADGQSVAAALDLARLEMEMNGLEDHDLPTLVHGPGINPDEAVLVVPPASTAAD